MNDMRISGSAPIRTTTSLVVSGRTVSLVLGLIGWGLFLMLEVIARG